MMKWACKNTLSVYNYTIDVENILSPVYHLIIDLIREHYVDQQFYEWIGNVFNFAEVTGQPQVANDVTEDSFLVAISHYLEDYLYEQSTLLESTEILLLYRTKHILITSFSTNKQVLIQWIKKSGMINKFFDLINNAGVNNVKDTLSDFLNDQYFGNSVKITESSLKGTFVSKNSIVDYKELPIDEESIWLCSKWKTKLGVQNNTQYSEVFIAGINDSCLSIGDWILPTEYIDSVVKPETSAEYFWAMLNNVFAKKVNRKSIYRDKCIDFANALKKTEFANLMTRLQYNLYLPELPTDMPGEYKMFFEEVYNIEQFKEETSQVLFTGLHVTEQVGNRQTILGLYKTVKNDTEFNLRAWINVDADNSQKLTTCRREEKVKIKTVYALKPYYSYYFCKDYFEDMFAGILDESCITSLSNFELYKSDDPTQCFIEIDNMVRKTDGTLVYIENKTTLSSYNIKDTLNKVSHFQRIMADNYPNVNIEYLLVSLYYNKTVEEEFSYFTNVGESTVKDFTIPVARHDGIKLRCIVEPEYAKLKSIMERLLK